MLPEFAVSTVVKTILAVLALVLGVYILISFFNAACQGDFKVCFENPLKAAVACSYFRCVNGCDSPEVDSIKAKDFVCKETCGEYDDVTGYANDYNGDGKICADEDEPLIFISSKKEVEMEKDKFKEIAECLRKNDDPIGDYPDGRGSIIIDETTIKDKTAVDDSSCWDGMTSYTAEPGDYYIWTYRPKVVLLITLHKGQTYVWGSPVVVPPPPPPPPSICDISNIIGEIEEVSLVKSEGVCGGFVEDLWCWSVEPVTVKVEQIPQDCEGQIEGTLTFYNPDIPNDPNSYALCPPQTAENCLGLGIPTGPRREFWFGESGTCPTAGEYRQGFNVFINSNGCVEANEPGSKLTVELTITTSNGPSGPESKSLDTCEIDSFTEGSHVCAAPPTDTTPPTVSVTHSPLNPNINQRVTITAEASDNVGVSEIKIYVDGVGEKTCSSSPCSHKTTYPAGTHTYYATAKDSADNLGRNPTTGTKTFTISPSSADAWDIVFVALNYPDTEESKDRFRQSADTSLQYLLSKTPFRECSDASSRIRVNYLDPGECFLPCETESTCNCLDPAYFCVTHSSYSNTFDHVVGLSDYQHTENIGCAREPGQVSVTRGDSIVATTHEAGHMLNLGHVNCPSGADTPPDACKNPSNADDCSPPKTQKEVEIDIMSYCILGEYGPSGYQYLKENSLNEWLAGC